MKKTFTIIRVSEEDQLKGYGPDVQWFEDVQPNAPLLGLQVDEAFRRVIQEPATSWERRKFETAVREALDLHKLGKIEALLFPRVDRETRFLFGSFPLLAEVVQTGVEVYFAREKLRLDPNDPETVERYLSKAAQAQAYVETMRVNTAKGRRRRAIQDHMMPTGHSKWAHDYHCYRKDSHQNPDQWSGRYTMNPERANWVRKWAHWILVDGVSINKCCQRMLNDFGIRIHRSTMVDVLSDPAVIGKFYSYTTKLARDATGRKHRVTVDEKDWLLVYEEPSQAILTQEQFYALRERFKRNRENSPRNTKHYYPPLRSLVFCKCGRRMVGVYRNQKPWYRCLDCGIWIKAMPLWNEVKRQVREMLLQPERLIPAVRAQLDSGKSIGHLEQDLKTNQQRLEMIDEAEQKALRLHLYLPNYPLEKLEAELHRIQDQRQELIAEHCNLEKRVLELKQAMVDEEGIRRFCQMATSNLDSMDDGQWRVLLESMRLRLTFDGREFHAKIALPVVEEGKGAIVLCSCRSSDR
jgi:hypothetical protein